MMNHITQMTDFEHNIHYIHRLTSCLPNGIDDNSFAVWAIKPGSAVVYELYSTSSTSSRLWLISLISKSSNNDVSDWYSNVDVNVSSNCNLNWN